MPSFVASVHLNCKISKQRGSLRHTEAAEPAPSPLTAPPVADHSPTFGRKKPWWFLSPTKAEALQTLPVETGFAFLLWKPKPCLSQFSTLINGNQRDCKNSHLGSWAAGADVIPLFHKQQDPVPITAAAHLWSRRHPKQLAPREHPAVQYKLSPQHPEPLSCTHPSPS